MSMLPGIPWESLHFNTWANRGVIRPVPWAKSLESWVNSDKQGFFNNSVVRAAPEELILSLTPGSCSNPWVDRGP